MHAGSLYLDHQSDGRNGAGDDVERVSFAIVGHVRKCVGALWQRTKKYLGRNSGHPPAAEVNDTCPIDAMKHASKEFQRRAKTMNSVAFDFIQTNTALILESERARSKINNAAVHAAQMATDIVGGRLRNG